jgi:hypothetical protein
VLGSRSWPSVGVAGGDAAFAEFGQHGGVVDAQVCADSREGPAEVVEVDGLVDLLGGKSAATHRHVVSFEDVADSPPFDAESGTQLVHGCSGLVSSDEVLDLDGIELPCPTRSWPVDGRRSGRGRVGELPEQCLQGFYLGFCAIVSSPKVHT